MRRFMFLTLSARGSVPFSVLLASSIVQDGHGMLPMLAHSRRAFLGIKAVDLAAGALCGAVVGCCAQASVAASSTAATDQCE